MCRDGVAAATAVLRLDAPGARNDESVATDSHAHWSTMFSQWIRRVRATHYSIRESVAQESGDALRADRVAIQVIQHMVSRPAVFRHRGKEYDRRVSALTGLFTASYDNSATCHLPSWEQLAQHLNHMPEGLKIVHMAVAVCGKTVSEAACGTELTSADIPNLLADLEEYLSFGQTTPEGSH